MMTKNYQYPCAYIFYKQMKMTIEFVPLIILSTNA